MAKAPATTLLVQLDTFQNEQLRHKQKPEKAYQRSNAVHQSHSAVDDE